MLRSGVMGACRCPSRTDGGPSAGRAPADLARCGSGGRSAAVRDGHSSGGLLNSPCARTRLTGAADGPAGQGGSGSWTKRARGAYGARARTGCPAQPCHHRRRGRRGSPGRGSPRPESPVHGSPGGLRPVHRSPNRHCLNSHCLSRHFLNSRSPGSRGEAGRRTGSSRSPRSPGRRRPGSLRPRTTGSLWHRRPGSLWHRTPHSLRQRTPGSPLPGPLRRPRPARPPLALPPRRPPSSSRPPGPPPWTRGCVLPGHRRHRASGGTGSRRVRPSRVRRCPTAPSS